MLDLTLASVAGMSRGQAEQAIRARVQTVYLGQRQVLVRVLGRQKLFLCTDDTGFACHVMMDGYWEMWLTQFFSRMVKPGMTVVDVGANVGYYTLLFGDAVGGHGRVIAVEPVPATADLLTRSVELNGHSGKTRIERLALGRYLEGTVDLLVPVGEPKNATVVAGPMPGTIAVRTTTLDALVGDLDRVDLIKIDAEGAEEDIFAGMEVTLARHKPNVLLEFNAARGASSAVFLASLRQRFGSIEWLDFNSELHPAVDAQLLNERVGEDWLLYLSGAR